MCTLDTKSIWWSKTLFLDLGILSVFFTHMESSGRLLRAGGRGWHTSRRHGPGKKKMEILPWCRRGANVRVIKNKQETIKSCFHLFTLYFEHSYCSTCFCSLGFYCIVYYHRRLCIPSLSWVESMEQPLCSREQNGLKGGVRQGRNQLNTDYWGQPAWPGTSA